MVADANKEGPTVMPHIPELPAEGSIVELFWGDRSSRRASTVGVPRFPVVRQGELVHDAGPTDGAAPALGRLGPCDLEIAWETSQGDSGSGVAVGLEGVIGRSWLFIDSGHHVVVRVEVPPQGFDAARFEVSSDRLLDIRIEVTLIERRSGEIHRWSGG